MDNKLFLQKIDIGKEYQIIDMIYQDKNLKNTFSNEKNMVSRLLNSVYTAFIKYDDKNVGFITIIENKKTNINEIDIGILTEYQNKGFATEALKQLKQIIITNKIEVEIQIEKSNIYAIKSVLKNNFVLSKEHRNYNYYTLSKKDKYSI